MRHKNDISETQVKRSATGVRRARTRNEHRLETKHFAGGAEASVNEKRPIVRLNEIDQYENNLLLLPWNRKCYTWEEARNATMFCSAIRYCDHSSLSAVMSASGANASRIHGDGKGCADRWMEEGDGEEWVVVKKDGGESLSRN